MKQRIKKAYYLEIIDVIPRRYIELLVAVEMRKRKFTFLEIGQHFGVSKQAAHQMVRQYESILGEPLKDRKHKRRNNDTGREKWTHG